MPCGAYVVLGSLAVLTLTELIKVGGAKNKQRMRNDLNRLINSNLVFVDVDHTIAMQAGELRLKYNNSAVDSLIAATGIVGNVKHILTDDKHVKPLKNQIKPVNLKAAMKLADRKGLYYFEPRSLQNPTPLQKLPHSRRSRD